MDQESQNNNREEQIRNLLSRQIDRIKEDIEYISNDVKLSELNDYALQSADVWSKVLESDIKDVEETIWDLRGEIDI